MRVPLERACGWVRAGSGAALVLCGVAASGGCTGDGRLPWRSEPVGRRPLEVAWDTAWVFRSELDDTTLTFPRALVEGDDGTVYVSDMGTRVVALDSSGAVKWTHGTKGAGPGEYRNITDIRLSQNRLFLHDAGNLRISVLGLDGEPVRVVSTQELPPLEAIIPLPDGRIAALAGLVGNGAGDEAVLILDGDGKVVKRLGIPLADYASLGGLAKQGVLAGDGERWAFAYHLANGWTTFSGASARGVGGRYVEDVQPPRVREERTQEGVRMRSEGRISCSACSASLSDSLLFVHFGGASDRRLGVMDVYDWAGGRYLASIYLPAKATHVAVHGDRVYLLKTSPVPQVVALRMAGPELSGLRRSSRR